MACASLYVDMMSLKLDGLLDDEDESLLQVHVADCTDCAVIWSAMFEADSLLVASAHAPVPVPATIHSAVMLRIALAPVYRPEAAGVAAVATPLLGSVITAAHAGADVRLPFGSNETLQEWQHRLSGYLRGAAAFGLLVAGTAGLMIGLVLLGMLRLDGPLAEGVAMLRTFIGASTTWLGSLFAGVGAGAVAAFGTIMGVMALVAWQVMSSYHRNTAHEHANPGWAEAVG